MRSNTLTRVSNNPGAVQNGRPMTACAGTDTAIGESLTHRKST